MVGQVTANGLHTDLSGNAFHSHITILHSSTGRSLPSSRRGRVVWPRHIQKVVRSYSAGQQGINGTLSTSFGLNSRNVSTWSHRSDTALSASASETPSQESPDLGLTVVQADDSGDSAPILSGAGGGIFFWWQLGAVKYLQQQHDLTKWQMRGASAGALVACLAACNVDSEKAYEAAHRLSEEKKLFERPLGLAGVWGNLVRQWLNEMLPDNAAELCRGRLKVVVTKIPSFQLTYIDDFATKDELIDACMASAHIPFFLDWRATAKYRGNRYIDGSLTDFINSNNSHLIHCNGEALILDYFQDEELQYERFDFVKLRNPDEIQGMINAGYKYAARLDEAGQLETFINGKSQTDALKSHPLGQSLDSIDSAPGATAMDLDIYQL